MPAAAPADDLPRRVAAVRRFNRFYTQRIGVLDSGLHRSRFTLAQARVLYELAHRDGLTASALRRELGLDPGYLSRMLRGFERGRLLTRKPATDDARRSVLSLTPAGRAAFAPLDAAARDEIGGLLRPLAAADQRRVESAMATIEALLGDRRDAGAPPFTLRDWRPGDIGWVISRHGSIYAEEFGWDATFEAFVAEIAAAFVKNHDPRRERCWIAERDGQSVGAVFLVRQSATVAKLRMLIVDPAARGLGIGQRLVAECIGFAREAGYRKLMLWTNANLRAARRLYVDAGFKLVAREKHTSFGKRLVGETWELAL